MGKTIVQEINTLRLKVVKFAHEIVNFSKTIIMSINSNKIAELDKVITLDGQNDRRYYKLFDDCVWLITRERPVASNMRSVIGFLFILRELEMVANGFVQVAKSARAIASIVKPKTFFQNIQPMYDMVYEQLLLLCHVLEDFSQEDLMKIIAADDQIDHCYREQLREPIIYLNKIKQPKQLQLNNARITTSKSLERTADHIINICWEIIYISTGTHREVSEYGK